MRRTWLKERRKNRHLTQAEVANLVGVSLRAVQQWEGGERTPSRAKQFKLSQALGKSVLRQFDAEYAKHLEAAS